MNFDQELDATGLKCPLPILKTKKALAAMHSGQVLKVVSTDPNTVTDFGRFAEQTGNQLVLQQQNDAHYVFYIARR